MKKATLLSATVIITTLAFAAIGIPTAADLPDEIIIKNEGYKSRWGDSVPFPHLRHIEDYGLDCRECHHAFKAGKNVWQEGDPVVKCAECHNPLKREGTVMRLPNAYHVNCKGCHKEMRDEKGGCGLCHKGK
jgi:hypothetical protein